MNVASVVVHLLFVVSTGLNTTSRDPFLKIVYACNSACYALSASLRGILREGKNRASSNEAKEVCRETMELTGGERTGVKYKEQEHNDFILLLTNLKAAASESHTMEYQCLHTEKNMYYCCFM